MITRTRERDVTPRFMERVAEWLSASGEVLVILRYLAAAGAKDYAFCRSMSELESLVFAAPDGTDIEVFREQKLPIRGLVTEDFVTSALRAIPNGDEYMLVAMDRQPGSVLSAFGSIGDTHDDLREDLNRVAGKVAAVGPCPPFCGPDSDDLISASKGGLDGPR